MRAFSFSNISIGIKIILVFVCVLFFLWILNENVPLAGIKKITYNFGTPSGIVTQLRPMARLGESGIENGVSYQKIIENPVYFDVRTPVTYDTMEVEVLYKNPTSRQFGLGIKQFATQTDFFTTPFIKKGIQGEWIVGKAEISLKEMQRLPGRYSLSLSLPGLVYHPDSSEGVLVSSVRITLTRKPLTLDNFFQSMNEILQKK